MARAADALSAAGVLVKRGGEACATQKFPDGSVRRAYRLIRGHAAVDTCGDSADVLEGHGKPAADSGPQ